MSSTLSIPYQWICDKIGRPIEAGKVYIGQVGYNPITNPITVYWDDALTQPASQPLSTIGGLIVRVGTPARIYLPTSSYSILVQDKSGSTVFYDANTKSSDAIGKSLESPDSDLGDALVAVKQPEPNSIARTQHEKNYDELSVKDFGAMGDGVTDDTAAIQNALNCANRKTIKFPAGIYNITSLITLGGNSKLLEFDSGAIIRRMFNGGAMMLVTGSRWRIVGGEFDGNKVNYENDANAGIFITGINNEVSSCQVYNSKSHGISIDGAGGQGTDNVVVNNFVNDCDAVGISQYKATNSIIMGNRIYGAGAEGITVDGTKRSRVVANCIVACGRIGAVGGIGVDAAYENTISNNLIVGTLNNLPGICLESQAANTHHNAIVGNTIIDNTGHGIWVRHRDVIFDLANNIYYAVLPGTYAQGDWNTITGNSIRGVPSGYYPIRVDQKCVGNVLNGNVYDGKLPSIDPTSVDTRTDVGLIGFMALNSVLRKDVTGNDTEYQIIFDVEKFDRGGCYNNTTGVFTALVNGIYQLSASVRTIGWLDHDFQILSIVTTGGTYKNGVSSTGQAAQMVNNSCTIYMAAGDTATIKVRVVGGPKVVDVDSDPSHTWFCGALVG